MQCVWYGGTSKRRRAHCCLCVQEHREAAIGPGIDHATKGSQAKDAEVTTGKIHVHTIGATESVVDGTVGKRGDEDTRRPIGPVAQAAYNDEGTSEERQGHQRRAEARAVAGGSPPHGAS